MKVGLFHFQFYLVDIYAGLVLCYNIVISYINNNKDADNNRNNDDDDNNNNNNSYLKKSVVLMKAIVQDSSYITFTGGPTSCKGQISLVYVT